MDPQLPRMPLSFFPQRDSTEVLDPSLRPAMAAQARISGWRPEPDVPEVPEYFRFSTIRTDVPAGLIRVRFRNLRCLPIIRLRIEDTTPGGPRLRERLDFTGHARRHSGREGFVPHG